LDPLNFLVFDASAHQGLGVNTVLQAVLLGETLEIAKHTVDLLSEKYVFLDCWG
jgi:hypothetical protein